MCMHVMLVLQVGHVTTHLHTAHWIRHFVCAKAVAEEKTWPPTQCDWFAATPSYAQAFEPIPKHALTVARSLVRLAVEDNAGAVEQLHVAVDRYLHGGCGVTGLASAWEYSLADLLHLFGVSRLRRNASGLLRRTVRLGYIVSLRESECNLGSLQRVDHGALADIGVADHAHRDGSLQPAVAAVIFQQLVNGVVECGWQRGKQGHVGSDSLPARGCLRRGNRCLPNLSASSWSPGRGGSGCTTSQDNSICRPTRPFRREKFVRCCCVLACQVHMCEWDDCS